MTVRTIPEAAAELRVSPRALQKIVVENGLYIAVSNRKRLTEEHYRALVAILQGAPCQSHRTSARTASTTSAAHTSHARRNRRSRSCGKSPRLGASWEHPSGDRQKASGDQVIIAIQPHPYQGCALPLSYRGDWPVSLVKSASVRKRANRPPCRTAQNDSSTRRWRWEMAGKFVPESSVLCVQFAHSRRTEGATHG